MKMGLFKKFKKEEAKEDIEKSQNIESNIDIKTTDNIQKEQQVEMNSERKMRD